MQEDRLEETFLVSGKPAGQKNASHKRRLFREIRTFFTRERDPRKRPADLSKTPSDLRHVGDANLKVFSYPALELI
jgi:hypothetical protein